MKRKECACILKNAALRISEILDAKKIEPRFHGAQSLFVSRT
jgi:hypothetical protein